MSIFKYIEEQRRIKSQQINPSGYPLPEGAKLIPNLPTYCVTAMGKVYSCRVYGSKIRRLGPWWEMKLKFRRSRSRQYYYVDLFREVGKPERWHVHELVLTVFVKPRPEGLMGCHKDDDSKNNHVGNLYWGTNKENVADAFRNKRIKLGEDRASASLTNNQIREIRKLRSLGVDRNILAVQFGKSPHYITRIATGEIWKHV